jgi:hypothetical protein
MKICALNGYVNYDELYFNIVANSDFSIWGKYAFCK